MNAKISPMIGLAALALIMTAAPASALLAQVVEATGDPTDRCNGLVEDDGCWYQDSVGVWHYCRLWVAGNCVRGG